MPPGCAASSGSLPAWSPRPRAWGRGRRQGGRQGVSDWRPEPPGGLGEERPETGARQRGPDKGGRTKGAGQRGPDKGGVSQRGDQGGKGEQGLGKEARRTLQSAAQRQRRSLLQAL